MNKKIFLSTPISGFENKVIFTLFREKVIEITTFLQKKVLMYILKLIKLQQNQTMILLLSLLKMIFRELNPLIYL